MLAAALVAAPILVMSANILRSDPDGIWGHLWRTVLPRYLLGSLVITVGAVVLAGAIGVGCAWLIVRCRFPGRQWLGWALLLPMAMPAYVLAYCWTDFLEYAGPVQRLLRHLTGLSGGEYWFPQIRSIPGAILVLGFVHYPYVYLSARAAFLEQGVDAYESARSLGWKPWRSFFGLSLPLTRPAIVAGCALVAMECLADYGTVDYFGVQTFTTGIYRTWTGFGSYTAASRLAAMLLLFVLVFLGLERLSRGRRRFTRNGTRQQRMSAVRLNSIRALAATGCCLVPLWIGFGFPVLILGRHVWRSATISHLAGLRVPAFYSLKLASITAVVAVVIAVVVIYGRRLTRDRLMGVFTRIAGLGYAIPGSVVAVAVIVPLAWLDNQLLDRLFGSGLLLSGSIFILLFAYLVRFLAVAMSTVETGMNTLTDSMGHAGRSLGAGPGRVLWRIHLPLMRASLCTAALMVFVDVLKELPATILLRPFHVTTLAVRIHEQVSQESLDLAALPALAIVVTGLLPVIMLTRSITQARIMGVPHA